jgi:hypothetical protein
MPSLQNRALALHGMLTALYLESKAKRPRLRVGVLIDGLAVPRYVATILEDIARSNFAAVELAIVLHAGPTADEGSPSLLHKLYTRADRAIGGEMDPLTLVEPGVGLVGVDRLAVFTGGGAQPWLATEVVDEIRRRELDVILRFCAATPRGEVLRAARHGVWSYHFGADGDARDGSPFFQQVVERAPTRDVQLEVLEDEPAAGLVLCRSNFGSQGNLLLASYRQVAFWETTHFVVWKLHDLHEHGWERVCEQAVARAPRVHAPGVAQPPTTREMVRFLAPRVAAAVVHRVRGERREHGVPIRWKIALRRGASPFGSTPETTSLAGFRWIEAPPAHFWADPFIFEHGGGTFLLFEDYEYEKRYGTIRGAEVREDCTLGSPFPCLDLGHHLSFPHVFDHDGETFMIPESCSDHTVTLYRARRFPDDWVKEKVLFRGNAADTISWREGGKFYFFTTLHDRDDRGMKTLLFVADSLTGEWRLHPANPVSSDVRHARGAGAIFREQGRLFRPSQDCGPRYGHGLNLEEVVTLSEDRYEERNWCGVEPSALPFPAIGVHTFSRSGDLEAIDACMSLGPRFGLAPRRRAASPRLPAP